MVRSLKAAFENEEHIAVLHLNIDDFNAVNEVFGNSVGDTLLDAMYTLLKSNIRKVDRIIRLKGDEFVLLLDNLRKSEYAGVVAQNILNALDTPFELGGQTIYTNISIGVAVYPDAGENAVALLQHAEIAMRKAKKHGKNQYYFYSNEMGQKNERHLFIKNGLRNALQKHEFYMLYQPIVDLKTGGCCGIEALLRWKHPQLGLLTPDEFLDDAKEMSLMSQIGKWVTQRVFSEFKQFNLPNFKFVSINVTAGELSKTKNVQAILAGIKEFDVDIDKIIFELTETSLVKNPEGLIKKLDTLFDTRIQLAIDDYGTGYSSLGYLKKLPIVILKIDQSFIQGMQSNPNDGIILESTIRLAHQLGIKVIVEGVEEKEQVEFLKKNKCDYVQGYYFSKPLSLKDVIQFIEQSKPHE
jgi:diguanylate cyclase (GGDEF)-like protein